MKIQKKITAREDKSIDKYFYDISKFRILTPDEEVDLFKRFKDDNDLLAREKLLSHNLKFVVSVAKKYQINSARISLVDLISAGNLGLLKAIDRFDHTKGFKFISYAVWWITQNILDHLNKTSNQVFMSANIINSNKKVNRIKEELFTRTETQFEASNLLEMELITDEDYKSYQTFSEFSSPASLDVLVGEDSNLLMSETIAGQTEQSEIEFSTQQNNYLIKRLIASAKITEREKKILFLSFGINSDRTYDIYQLGEMFSMTAERIRQIKHKALLKIKNNSLELKIDVYEF